MLAKIIKYGIIRKANGGEMININNLTEKDIGKWVIYNDIYKIEKGRIKSWNKKYIFVVYRCDNNWDNFLNYTGAATSPEDLKWSGK